MEKDDKTVLSELQLETIPLGDLPGIPYKIIEFGNRVSVPALDNTLYRSLILKFGVIPKRYRFKVGVGPPGVGDAEVWVVGETVYISEKWFDEIEGILEFAEETIRIGGV